jgi:hypothetical protein
MLRRLAPLIGLPLLALTACSPAQEAAWWAWWEDDPQEAAEWAVNECGELCTNDTNHNGIVEPDAGSSGGGDDATSSDTSDGSDEPDQEAGYDGDDGGGTVWDSLAQCESGGNWHISTGNGYYGGLQFLLSTWQAYGGSGYPHENSREEQIRVAENLRADAGYSPWPACSAQLGL